MKDAILKGSFMHRIFLYIIVFSMTANSYVVGANADATTTSAIYTRYDGPERSSTPNMWKYEYVGESIKRGVYKFTYSNDGGGFVTSYRDFYVGAVRIVSWRPASSTTPTPFFGTIYHVPYESLHRITTTNTFGSVLYAHSEVSPPQSSADCNYGYSNSSGMIIDFIGTGVWKSGEKWGYPNQLNASSIKYPFIKYVGPYCFASNSVLTSVVVPEGVTHIEEGAFSGCRNLTTVTLPSTLEEIGENAFDGCGSLTAFITNDGNANFKSVDGALFTKDGKRLVAFPPGKGGNYMLPADVETIDEHAFSGCTNVVVEIPWENSLEWWLPNPFADCLQVRVDVPEGLTKVQLYEKSFYPFITHVRLPATWQGGTIGGSQFGSCGSLVSLEVAPDNTRFKSIDGVIFTKDGLSLVAYPPGRSGAYAISPGVTSIWECAFYDCYKLSSISVSDQNLHYESNGGVLFSKGMETLLCFPAGKGEEESYLIPSNVSTLASYSFCGSALSSVTIPSNVTTICSEAFLGAKITSATLSCGAKTIQDATFLGCYQMESVYLPEGIETIGTRSFNSCGKLKNIELPNSVLYVFEDAFDGCGSISSITVPYSFKNVVSDWNLPATCEIVLRAPMPLEIIQENFVWEKEIANDPGLGCYMETNLNLVARGGVMPYTWRLGEGSSLPGSLEMNEFGYFSGWIGTSDAGEYSFEAIVTDAEGNETNTTVSLTISVIDGPAFLGFSPDMPVTVRVGETVEIEALVDDSSGESLVLDWEEVDESIESFVSIGNETAIFSWTPTSADIGERQLYFSYSTEELAARGHYFGKWAPKIHVVPAGSIVIDNNLPHAVEGVEYTVQLTATGGTAPYTWSMEENYDAGITLDGVLTFWSDGWVIESSTTEDFEITVTDASGLTITQTVYVVLDPNPNRRPEIVSQSPWDDGIEWDAILRIGEAQTFSVEAHDPEGEPLTFFWRLDDEPIDCPTDSWTWTPLREDIGKHALSVFCSDGERESWSWNWNFKVVTTNVLSVTATLPAATVGQPYEAALSVTGGTEPYSWAFQQYGTNRTSSTFAETGVAQDWSDDDECWRVALPFSFPFYGSTYDEIWVSDNGTICLDGEYSKYFYDEDDFKSHAMIAPLWCDLDGTRQTIYVDSSVSGQITIRWTAHIYGAVTDETDPDVCFSATLCDDGIIRFSYGDSCYGGAIGISDGNATPFLLQDVFGTIMSGADDIAFTQNSFPPGLAITSGGVVSGTPSNSGKFKVPVAVTDADGATCSGEVPLIVLPPANATIPELAGETSEAVTNAIASAGFIDAEALQDAIGGDAAKYNEFKTWAQAVKDAGGEAAGEAAVVASERVAISYLLGTDTLITNDIESEDVHITGFSIDHGAESGGGETQFSFEVAIDGVNIGSSDAMTVASLKENLRKAIGIEGATRLDGEFSSANIELTFNAPVDGKARFTATPPSDAGDSFFMRAKVK